MERPTGNNYNQELKQKLLDILDEETSRSFSEIKEHINDVEEEELREALIDLLDKNRVVANVDWEYRQRPLEA